MRTLVTVLDSAYLPRVLSLHASLTRHASNWRLVVVCYDNLTYRALDSLRLSGVETVRVGDMLTREHREAQESRTRVESIWSLTPLTIMWAREKYPDSESTVYVDADMYLLQSFEPFFTEFSHGASSTLLTPHAFSPGLDYSNISGRFCVQFQAFKRGQANEILGRWNSQCLEWCGQTPESGKFGDQKYLDAWPGDFGQQVAIVSQPGWFLGPWNVQRFPWSDALFYHFHALSLIGPRKVALGNYSIPNTVRENVYHPYLQDLRKSVDLLAQVTPEAPWVKKQPLGTRVVGTAKVARRRLWDSFSRNRRFTKF